MTEPQGEMFTVPPEVEPARNDDLQALASARPAGVFLGTSSWSFPGWRDLVYRGAHDDKTLARAGLAAYTQHPLLNAVGLDRTHYAPISSGAFADYAAVADGALFLVKAHEDLTLHRFPTHARYGTRRGQHNDTFLNAGYAADVVVAPAVEGLGGALGAIVFQFAPQDLVPLGGAAGFVEQLHSFLLALPRLPSHASYAVEVRNEAILCRAYRDALVDAGVCHCLNAIAGMPSVREQVFRVQDAVAPPGTPGVVGRWLLRKAYTYSEAYERYAPFGRMVDPDDDTRGEWARVIAHALSTSRRALITVNNKAEGCAPRSVEALVRLLVGE